MPTVKPNQLKEQYTALYTVLEQSLEKLSSAAQKPSGRRPSLDAITLIRGKILELRTLSRKGFVNTQEEIGFFRNGWPLFYAKLFLYIKIHHYEINRSKMPVELWPALIKREERQIIRFLHDHAEFGMYYEAGSPAINLFFTREHSHEWALDELSMIIDPENATVASIRAAWWLAYGKYRDFLEKETDKLLHPEIAPPEPDEVYEWGASETSAVEWLYALQASEVIKFNGQPADISRLQRWFKTNFQKDINNIYDRFKVIRNRKRDRMPFMHRMMNLLEKKMDVAERKFK